MARARFSLADDDPRMAALMAEADHRTLAVWAKDCAARVLGTFEADHPDDPRPRAALDTLQAWIDTGEFSMRVIRAASLGAHAAARDTGADNPARSAARAAGQAVATAHVRTHAPGAARYAAQAIHRASGAAEAEAAVEAERAWQIERLRELVHGAAGRGG